MKKTESYLAVLFMCMIAVGCTQINPTVNQNISVMNQIPGKNCVSLGELSSSVGSGPYQVKELKNRAAQKGANAILIKSQKLYFRKQISGMVTTTTIEAFQCS